MVDAENGTLVFRLNDGGTGPELIRQVLLERGWVEYTFYEEKQDDMDWNLWWRTSRFRTGDYEQVMPWQRLNHYPKSTAITKKDSLARNLRRMKAVYGHNVYNFSPTAFNLPNDYTKFVAEYTKFKEKNPDKGIYWICKPADLSRGRGIFIFRELSNLQYDCNAVVQQYISNPLLIAGYKFDLRIYVMVPSFHPLTIYIYQEGLVRFSTEKYDLGSLNNMFSHLTNTSINKHSPSYATDKERVGPGCKWTLTQLRHYFHQANIDDRLLWVQIVNIVNLTLLIQASQVPRSQNCFELYGFDIIIDENVKPWLLEVNFSPALGSDCPSDLMVKKPMLHDIIEMLDFTAKDTERGGAAGRTSPCRELNQSGKSRMQQTYAGGNAPAVNRPRNTKQSSIGHLPSIPTAYNCAGNMQQPNWNDSNNHNNEDHHDIIPIVPGCGLPSVQQTTRWHCTVGSSGCSSAESNSSVQTEGDHELQALDVKRGTPNSCPKLMDFNTHKKFGLISGEKTKLPQKIKGSTLDGKISTLSDSAISSSSETRDKSDPRRANSGGSEYHKKSSDWKKQGSLAFRRASVESQEDIISSPSSRLVLNEISPNSAACINHPEKDTDATPEKDFSSSDQATKRKLSQISYTANPLTKRSSFIHRTSSRNSLLGRPSAYPRPWQQSKTNAASNSTSKKGKHKMPLDQVGEFILAFPFNEITRKSSMASLDVRVIIQETQKLIKQWRNATHKKSSFGGPGSFQREGFPELPALWRPVRNLVS